LGRNFLGAGNRLWPGNVTTSNWEASECWPALPPPLVPPDLPLPRKSFIQKRCDSA